MTPSRDLRPSGVPYSNGEPNPLRCALWRWSADGKTHERCTRFAAVDSAPPGRIKIHACTQCHYQREQEARQ